MSIKKSISFKIINYHYKISYFIIIHANVLQIIIDDIMTMNKKLCLYYDIP